LKKSSFKFWKATFFFLSIFFIPWLLIHFETMSSLRPNNSWFKCLMFLSKSLHNILSPQSTILTTIEIALPYLEVSSNYWQSMALMMVLFPCLKNIWFLFSPNLSLSLKKIFILSTKQAKKEMTLNYINKR